MTTLCIIHFDGSGDKYMHKSLKNHTQKYHTFF